MFQLIDLFSDFLNLANAEENAKITIIFLTEAPLSLVIDSFAVSSDGLKSF